MSALNDGGAITGMDVREDGVYITYVPSDGADAVSKKLGSKIVDLGTGRTFDIKEIEPEYQNLTLSNFIVEVQSFSANTSSSTGNGTTLWPHGYFTLTKNYDQASGILNAYGTLRGGYTSSAAGVQGWAEATQDVHAYLIIM